MILLPQTHLTQNFVALKRLQLYFYIGFEILAITKLYQTTTKLFKLGSVSASATKSSANKSQGIVFSENFTPINIYDSIYQSHSTND